MGDEPIPPDPRVPWSAAGGLGERFEADRRPVGDGALMAPGAPGTTRMTRATGLARLAEYQPIVVLVWFVVYLVLGEDGFLASTLDHVDSLWLVLTVFNVPLQLVACVLVLMLRNADRMRAAQWIALPSLVLLGAHFVISFAVWAQRSLG